MNWLLLIPMLTQVFTHPLLCVVLKQLCALCYSSVSVTTCKTLSLGAAILPPNTILENLIQQILHSTLQPTLLSPSLPQHQLSPPASNQLTKTNISNLYLIILSYEFCILPPSVLTFPVSCRSRLARCLVSRRSHYESCPLSSLILPHQLSFNPIII